MEMLDVFRGTVLSSRRVVGLCLAVAVLLVAAACSSGGGGNVLDPVAETTTFIGTVASVGPGATNGALIVQLPQSTAVLVLAAPPAIDGSLILDSGEVIDLLGTLDGVDVVLDGGGYGFTGVLSGSEISGTFTSPGGGPSSFLVSEDTSSTPFDAILGTWNYTIQETGSCTGSDNWQGSFSGITRFRFDDGLVFEDYDLLECSLPDPLTDLSWNENTYTQSLEETSEETSKEGTCVIEWQDTTTITFLSDSASGTYVGSAIYSGDDCPSDGTSCSWTGTITSTRCSCWPSACTASSETQQEGHGPFSRPAARSRRAGLGVLQKK